jgi:hypothetical protein
MTKSTRRFTGNRPKWKPSTTAFVPKLTAQWDLYRKTKSASDWLKVKLTAREPQPGKANYWLAWNGERLAGSSEHRRLKEEHPHLLRQTIRHLSNL